ELRMVEDVGGRIVDVPEEVGPIIAGVGVPLERRGKGVEGGGGEAFPVYVGQRAHKATVADAQEIEVIRVPTVFGEDGYRVQARAVVVKLPLDAGQLAAVEEIPVTAGVPVIAPVRHGRHVAEDRIERDLRFLFVAEIPAPRIDLFLAGRVPRHLAAERILFPVPAL